MKLFALTTIFTIAPLLTGCQSFQIAGSPIPVTTHMTAAQQQQ